VRFVSILAEDTYRLGIQLDGKILNVSPSWATEKGFPLTMEELVQRGFEGVQHSQSLEHELLHSNDYVGNWMKEGEVQFAPSVIRGRKIICVGLNYQKHANESMMDLPKVPLLFSKFDNTLTGHNAEVTHPRHTHQMDYEAEIAVLIGKQAKNVSDDMALDCVLGYTLANDLSARDMQFVTSQWLLGKTYDGFCPVGPALVTVDEVPNINDIRFRCMVLVQRR
jgi:2-keto-4-pentenoate hydratase/2-oxohepta-3-ene-1,7-dioic acid hydratase in catechol pathway